MKRKKTISSKYLDPIRSVSKLMVLQISIGIVGFVNVLLIGKHLSPEGYASFALMLSVYYTFSLFLSPVRQVINKEMPILFERGEQGKIKYVYTRSARYISLLMAFAFFVILIWKQGLMRLLKIDDSSILFSIAVMVLVNMLLDIFKSMSNADRDYKQYSKIFYIEAVIRLVATIAFIITIMSPLTATLSYILGSFSALLFAVYANKWLFTTETYYPSKKINWSWLVPVVLSSFVFVGFNAGDMVLVKALLNSHEAGLYGAATQIAKIFIIIGVAFTVYMFPITSSAAKKGTPIIKKLLASALTYLALATIGLLGLMVFNRGFIVLLFNQNYVNAGLLSVVLAAGMTMLCISQLFIQLFLVLEAKRILSLLLGLVVIDYIVIILYGNSPLRIAIIHTLFIAASMLSCVGSLVYLKHKNLVT